MLFLYTVSLLATILPFATAQQIIPTAGSTSFPSCALSCQLLLQAQTVCTPPSAIVSNQQTYNNCFCTAPFLADLYTTGETVCTANCTTTADRQLLSTWFVGLCKAVGQNLGYLSASPTTLATSTTSGGAQQTGTSSSSGSTTYGSTQSNGPWIKTHYQYIIMLIFLFFGFLALGLGARWLKKKHDQKRELHKAAMIESQNANGKGMMDKESALTSDSWEAQQHDPTVKDYQYTPHGPLPIIDEAHDSSAKETKRTSHVGVTEVQPVLPPIHTRHSKIQL